MPERDGSNLPSNCLRRLGAVGWMALLAACSGADVHRVDIQTAATGTEIEAKQVVALVYGGAPDAEIGKLLYSGGDLTAVVKRLRDRHPQLRTWLDQGAIGNTAGGFVALRDPALAESLGGLLGDENRDRVFLYQRAAAVVGHGGDTLAAWLPYASSTFGKEWAEQGEAGWWILTEARAWEHR